MSGSTFNLSVSNNPPKRNLDLLPSNLEDGTHYMLLDTTTSLVLPDLDHTSMLNR